MDPAKIFDRRAIALAERIAVLGAEEVETAYPLAMLYHYRSLIEYPAHSAADRAQDAEQAMKHFHTVYQRAGDLLPNPIRDILSDAWGLTPSKAAA